MIPARQGTAAIGGAPRTSSGCGSTRKTSLTSPASREVSRLHRFVAAPRTAKSTSHFQRCRVAPTRLLCISRFFTGMALSRTSRTSSSPTSDSQPKRSKKNSKPKASLGLAKPRQIANSGLRPKRSETRCGPLEQDSDSTHSSQIWASESMATSGPGTPPGRLNSYLASSSRTSAHLRRPSSSESLPGRWRSRER
jgi:hypothetical protein